MPPGTKAKLLTMHWSVQLARIKKVNRLTTTIRNRKFANELTRRIVDINSVAYTSIDVPIGVGMDAIGKAVVTVGKELSVGKSFSVSRNVVSVYRRGVREIVLSTCSVQYQGSNGGGLTIILPCRGMCAIQCPSRICASNLD
jgi:hypothetical protein